MYLVSVDIFLKLVISVLEDHFFFNGGAYFIKNSQSTGVRN